MIDYSEDDFLDGQIKLRQPKKGYRAGADAVLLGAAVPKMEGRLLEAGIGVGAPSLCYLKRMQNHGLSPNVIGVEYFDEVEKLAHQNIEHNGFVDQLSIINADIFAKAAEHETLGLMPDSFDHIFSNPPFFNPKSSKTSENDYKAQAHSISDRNLSAWLIFMVRLLKNKSEMTLIFPMEHMLKVLKILETRCGNMRVKPIYSKAGCNATRFLLAAEKGSKAPMRMLRPLTLRDENGEVTERADEIFRAGNKVSMD